jgi:hypothetical protein
MITGSGDTKPVSLSTFVSPEKYLIKTFSFIYICISFFLFILKSGGQVVLKKLLLTTSLTPLTWIQALQPTSRVWVSASIPDCEFQRSVYLEHLGFHTYLCWLSFIIKS